MPNRSGLSYRRSAPMYGIPPTTPYNYDHMSGKVEVGAQPGPKRYLSDEEEELARFLVEVAKIGYPHTKSQTLALVNPRRACAARITVVGSVCACVCVCYSQSYFSGVSSSHKGYDLLNGQ